MYRPPLAEVDRLIFVCKGNICRSAYAAARARALGVAAESLGLQTRTGLPADALATASAASFGIDLSAHRTRKLEDVQPRRRDLFLCMEPWQCVELQHQIGPVDAQIALLGLYARRPRPLIHDPFGLDVADFAEVFSFIDESMSGLIAGLRPSADAPSSLRP